MKDKKLEGYLFSLFHSCLACLIVSGIVQAILFQLVVWWLAILVGCAVGVFIAHHDHKAYKENF